MPGRSRVGKRLLWLEITKAIALVLIVFNHAVERMGELPHVFNPSDDWAPLGERISQLEPTGGSLWDLAFNAIRYPGLLGEVGVQLFVIASGFGLALSALRRGGVDGGFLRRRINRIAPTWIGVHILALLASIPMLLFLTAGASDRAAAVWDIRFWASLIGFRVTPETIYYLVPAWWFIALLIQLYLAFPILYRWFNRLGPARWWYLIGGSVVIKLIGLLVFDTYLDVWSRGAIFVTRLPEFAFGMLAAHWLTARDNWLHRNETLTAALLAIPVGIVSGLYLVGNAWGPVLFGAGLFVVIYRLFCDRELRGRLASGAIWTGRHSLVLFIVHQPVYYMLMPRGMAGPVRVLGGVVAAAVGTVVAGFVLEFVVERSVGVWQRWVERGVVLRRVATIGVASLLAYGVLVAGDLWIRANDPQEVLGWGERPSLMADDELGWCLTPNQTTRLQWQSYDYEVTANRLGFPGPVDTPQPGDLRILTLGDAFTSAEGVDTDRAWPRLVEKELGAATVWNGAITGFGPPQYADVAGRLAGELQPDIVIVGFFVNDFFDAEFDLDDMQVSIGFGEPDPSGLVPSLQWRHLSRYLRYHVTEPLLALKGTPNRTGYMLGHFDSLDPGAIDATSDGYAATVAAMEELARIAPEARRVMMLIPASVQVCEPAALEYFPANVDLTDYDMDQPQRLARDIAAATGMEVFDLRPVLSASVDCPYQPANMHWTEQGHQTVSSAVVDYLESS